MLPINEKTKFFGPPLGGGGTKEIWTPLGGGDQKDFTPFQRKSPCVTILDSYQALALTSMRRAPRYQGILYMPGQMILTAL